MKIEAGKKYTARNGIVFGPLSASTFDFSSYPFIDLNVNESWTETGGYFSDNETSQYDLIAEYVEPVEVSPEEPAKDVTGIVSEAQAAFDQFKPYADAAEAALAEVVRAKQLWPRNFASMHEGYSVIAEELNKELWEIVCQKQPNRDLTKARTEAIQVAAMAIRFAVEVCDEQNGRA